MSFPMRDVEFRGSRDAEGELTWGQRFFWDLYESTPPEDQGNVNVGITTPVPPGKSVDEVLTAVSWMLSRYEALRTTFFCGASDDPRQLVHRSGRVGVAMVETGDIEGILSHLDDVIRRRPLNLSEMIPVRLALISVEGRPSCILLVASHVAADGWGLQLIRRDLEQYLTRGSCEPYAGIQPLDQALFESSDAGRASSKRALEYWRTQISRYPSSMYEGIQLAPAAPRYIEATLEAPALTIAAREISRRIKTTPASAVLAAYVLLTAHRAGQRQSNFCLYSGNRFNFSTRESVGAFSQQSPISIETSRDSFTNIVRGAHRSALSLYRNGAYPPPAAAAILAESNASWQQPVECDSVVNIVSKPVSDVTSQTYADLQSLRKLEACSEFVVQHRYERAGHALNLRINSDMITVLADTSVYAEEHAEELLRGMQRTLIAAATGSDSVDELLNTVRLPVR
ncbi:condensation domain-containing protein [Streptomyces canus]|uniref:condensation domain-containing protein n=1 Tax=Streptomyces canus TaxID=58343 RepID=UPI0030DDE9CA